MEMVKIRGEQATPEEETVEPIKKPIYHFFKRGFDIAVSLAASIVLCLPMAVIAVVISVKDKGNPFYFHERIGKNGTKIRVCKFRSMKKGADDLERALTPEQLAEYRKEFKLWDDPRLIGYKNSGDGGNCFGAKLRRMSIDELPQIFFNILVKGDMSVVGPRPILREELEKNYTPAQQRLLLSVKPGLTGYWQVIARNNAGYANGRRQEMELYYIRNRSFRLDLKIMLKTVGVVLKKEGVS